MPAPCIALHTTGGMSFLSIYDSRCWVLTVGFAENMRNTRAVYLLVYNGWYLTCPNAQIAEDAVQYLTGEKLIPTH